jgi:hypothetical protein
MSGSGLGRSPARGRRRTGDERSASQGGLGISVADGEEDLVFSLVQLCASATGKPLTDDELALIAGYPRQLALLFPGQL